MTIRTDNLRPAPPTLRTLGLLLAQVAGANYSNAHQRRVGGRIAADAARLAEVEEARREAESPLFVQHLEWASKVVATWPEWKRNLLGRVDRDAHDPHPED